jgi:hypothetical protein
VLLVVQRVDFRADICCWLVCADLPGAHT